MDSLLDPTAFAVEQWTTTNIPVGRPPETRRTPRVVTLYRVRIRPANEPYRGAPLQEFVYALNSAALVALSTEAVAPRNTDLAQFAVAAAIERSSLRPLLARVNGLLGMLGLLSLCAIITLAIGVRIGASGDFVAYAEGAIGGFVTLFLSVFAMRLDVLRRMYES